MYLPCCIQMEFPDLMGFLFDDDDDADKISLTLTLILFKVCIFFLFFDSFTLISFIAWIQIKLSGEIWTFFFNFCRFHFNFLQFMLKCICVWQRRLIWFLFLFSSVKLETCSMQQIVWVSFFSFVFWMRMNFT